MALYDDCLFTEISTTPFITATFFPAVNQHVPKFFDTKENRGYGSGNRMMLNILTDCLSQNWRDIRIDKWPNDKKMKLAKDANREKLLTEIYKNWTYKSVRALALWTKLNDWGGCVRISIPALEKAKNELQNQTYTFLSNAAFLGLSFVVGNSLDKIQKLGPGAGMLDAYRSISVALGGGTRFFVEVICFNPMQMALNKGVNDHFKTNNGQTNGIKTTFALVVDTDNFAFTALDFLTDVLPFTGQVKLAFNTGFNVGMMLGQAVDIFGNFYNDKKINEFVTNWTQFDLKKVLENSCGPMYWYPNLLKNFSLTYFFRQQGIDGPYIHQYLASCNRYLDKFLKDNTPIRVEDLPLANPPIRIEDLPILLTREEAMKRSKNGERLEDLNIVIIEDL